MAVQNGILARNEVRVVERVEELNAKLDVGPFRHAGGFSNAEVCLEEPLLIEHPFAEVSELAGFRKSEQTWFER